MSGKPRKEQGGVQTLMASVQLKDALEKRELCAGEEHSPPEVVWNVLGDLLEIQGDVLSLDGHQSNESNIWLRSH